MNSEHRCWCYRAHLYIHTCGSHLNTRLWSQIWPYVMPWLLLINANSLLWTPHCPVIKWPSSGVRKVQSLVQLMLSLILQPDKSLDLDATFFKKKDKKFVVSLYNYKGDISGRWQASSLWWLLNTICASTFILEYLKYLLFYCVLISSILVLSCLVSCLSGLLGQQFK